jgi:nucleotide-binding universal stress UspA family protein
VFERILLAYGPDGAGRDAAVLAARLAAASGGSLTIVFPYHPLLADADAMAVEQRVRRELAALLGDEQMLLGAGCRWSASSWPIRALHELAAFEGADVIVFGAAERTDGRHISLMERIVHGAPCAVAAAPEGYSEHAPPSLRRIGAGFADTQEGRAAIDTAIELAERVGGELRIIAAAGLEPALAAYALSSASLPALEEEMYEQTKGCLERVAGELGAGRPAAGLRAETLRGEPGAVLCAASENLDLLVLGSRAYGPVRRALLGSVSAEAMRTARCPVLVVPRRADAEDPTSATTDETAAHTPSLTAGDRRGSALDSGTQRA